jgi:hypothetical protein
LQPSPHEIKISPYCDRLKSTIKVNIQRQA